MQLGKPVKLRGGGVVEAVYDDLGVLDVGVLVVVVVGVDDGGVQSADLLANVVELGLGLGLG